MNVPARGRWAGSRALPHEAERPLQEPVSRERAHAVNRSAPRPSGQAAGGTAEREHAEDEQHLSDLDPHLQERSASGISPSLPLWTPTPGVDLDLPASSGLGRFQPYCPATKPHVVPETHRPPLQTSPTVQLFPSEQAAVLLVWTQPVAELQVSSVQAFPSSQLSAGPPTHPPPLHASFVVQTLPSSQGAVLFVWTQPVA